MKQVNIIFSLSLCWTALLFGCSSGPEKKTPKAYTVEIKQMQFQPADLKVESGDTVVFKNEDMVAHDITEASSKKWSSGALPSGQSWKLVVVQKADYYCSIHPVMKGRLEVR